MYLRVPGRKAPPLKTTLPPQPPLFADAPTQFRTQCRTRVRPAWGMWDRLKDAITARPLRALGIFGLLALAGCGEPATDAQIRSYYADTTTFNAERTSINYLRADGVIYKIDTVDREKLSGRWYAKNGQLCRNFRTQPVECADMFVREGAVRTSLGGYNVAQGDLFNLSSRFGQSSRTSGSRDAGLAGLITGLAVGATVLGQFMQSTCPDGGCAAPTTSASSARIQQCEAERTSCLAGCARLPERHPGQSGVSYGLVGGPAGDCRHECRGISCY